MCRWGVRLFMLSIEGTFINFNLYSLDEPSIEDGPRSLDIGNDLKIT